MSKKTLAIALAGVLVLLGAAAAAGWYAGWGPFAGRGAGEAARRPVAPVPSEHYVTLDKLVVMTRSDGARGRPRYLALDLVFAVADKEAAKRTTAQLPLLRSVALRTLSAYTADELRQMQVDQIAGLLDDQFVQVYGGAGRMPFNQVLVARMMLE
ncbi:MAG: flagellar basal body-associated FliL family protein [Lysobacteraceae bacterium]|nr:flagellar basal body protein [Xanthomonadaceae bacterium]